MKKLVAFLVFFACFVCSSAQVSKAFSSGTLPPDGLLQGVQNGVLVAAGEDFVVTRKDHRLPIEMTFIDCQGLGVSREHDQWWILPTSATDTRISANKYLWVLPLNASSKEHSWDIDLQDGDVSATKAGSGMKVLLNADRVTLRKAEARPHSDPFGHRFSLTIADGKELEDALAAFYWGTMLPLVVEKTMAVDFPYSSGYVLSTLRVSSYAGSYPAVDHEFHDQGAARHGL